MDSPRLSFAIYGVIKYFAYVGWCYLGIRLLGEFSSRGFAAFWFGFVRLMLGVFFGITIFLIGASMHLNAPSHPFLVYLAVYAPVRLIEWSIMGFLLRSLTGGFPIDSVRTALWILGGIVVSHLADVALLALTGTRMMDVLPVGRFLC